MPSSPAPAEPTTTDAEPVPLHLAYRACEEIARAHYENFPVASRFIPADRRIALAAIYAFARQADDVADAAAPSEDRLRALDTIEGALLQALDGEPRGPIFTALADAVERHRLSAEPFLDLLGAFRLDARDATFPTWDDLLGYCRGSANPVGRLVLALYGIEDPEAIRASDAVCTALQLTNFWQDLGQDLSRGRLFLPLEDLERFQLRREDLRRASSRAALTRLLTHECRATRDLFARGAPVVRMTPVLLSLHLRATIAGGRAILRAVERLGWRVLEKRPTLHGAARVGVVIRALAGLDG
jgi:hydroxysqualene synthase